DGASGIGARLPQVFSAGYKYRCSCPTDSEAPLQPLAFLRLILLAPNDDKIIRQARQQIERSHHGSVLLPQDDLIPSPKDFNFLALQSKLLRQPDGLTVSRPEHSRCAHAPTSDDVYTSSIHILLLV